MPCRHYWQHGSKTGSYTVAKPTLNVTLKCLLTSSRAFGRRQQAESACGASQYLYVFEVRTFLVFIRNRNWWDMWLAAMLLQRSAEKHWSHQFLPQCLNITKWSFRQWCKHSMTRSEMTPYVLLRTHRRHPWASIILGTICTSPLTERGKGAFSALYLVMISHNPLNEEAKKGKNT